MSAVIRPKAALRSAFTLVETLMVILLVAILTTVVLPQFVDFKNDAKSKVTQAKLAALKKAIVGDPGQVANGSFINAGFENHIGAPPADLSELATQGAYDNYDPFTHRGWRGPYIDTTVGDWDKDAWGTTLEYDDGGRVITSCGVDLTCGNSDDLFVTF